MFTKPLEYIFLPAALKESKKVQNIIQTQVFNLVKVVNDNEKKHLRTFKALFYVKDFKMLF